MKEEGKKAGDGEEFARAVKEGNPLPLIRTMLSGVLNLALKLPAGRRFDR